jgi:D-glycero-D-manno-heptose 1,7-bisphosphate phosphatase
MARPAVFLDRDGVLNRAEVRDGKPFAPLHLRDFRLLPGTGAAVRALREAGYLLVVVTNQPDIGHGRLTTSVVEAMHARLRRHLRPDAIEMCPHRQDEGCPCRKPRPGMLRSAAERLDIDLHRSFMVGDRGNDIAAGRAAGCCTILVDRGYREPRPVEADVVVRSFPAAARRILDGAAVLTGVTEGER